MEKTEIQIPCQQINWVIFTCWTSKQQVKFAAAENLRKKFLVFFAAISDFLLWLQWINKLFSFAENRKIHYCFRFFVALVNFRFSTSIAKKTGFWPGFWVAENQKIHYCFRFFTWIAVNKPGSSVVENRKIHCCFRVFLGCKKWQSFFIFSGILLGLQWINLVFWVVKIEKSQISLLFPGFLWDQLIFGFLLQCIKKPTFLGCWKSKKHFFLRLFLGLQ